MKEQIFNSIKSELESVISEYIDNNNIDVNNNFCIDNARTKVVDNGYIKGCENANEWFQKHNITESEAIDYVKQWEDDNCGGFEGNTKSEYIANMIAYIISFDCFCKEVA